MHVAHQNKPETTTKSRREKYKLPHFRSTFVCFVWLLTFTICKGHINHCTAVQKSKAEKIEHLPLRKKSDTVPTHTLFEMVLTKHESTQRRRWIDGNQFNKTFAAEAIHYQQQHNREVLQRHHRIYNDLNLFNPPANVNVVKPQPPIEPAVRVSHISSNGYYGFVHIHQDNDGAIGAIENEASMDCTEEAHNHITRKREFEIEQPQLMSAAKKCRLHYEGT